MGGYTETEIIPDLVVGEMYTERQILIYLLENPDVSALSLSKQLSDYSSTTRRVIARHDGYYYNARQKRTMVFPTSVNTLFIVE